MSRNDLSLSGSFFFWLESVGAGIYVWLRSVEPSCWMRLTTKKFRAQRLAGGLLGRDGLGRRVMKSGRVRGCICIFDLFCFSSRTMSREMVGCREVEGLASFYRGYSVLGAEFGCGIGHQRGRRNGWILLGSVWISMWVVWVCVAANLPLGKIGTAKGLNAISTRV
jgi:hypothetical protein